MSVDTIELWHKRARPNPTDKDFSVQLGCHLEEVAEMIESLTFTDKDWSQLAGVNTYVFAHLKDLSEELKAGVATAAIADRKEFLDSLADQIVTATGAGHCAGMRVSDAYHMVDSSNWSKFDKDGQPIFDANGKIAKGPNYAPPNLEGLY